MTTPTPNCGWLQPLGRSLDVLLRHFPLGSAWLAFRLPGKRANRMVSAFALAFEDAWSALCNLATELNPYSTTQLLPEWERAVSLPDPCLPSATTIEQRRAQVVFRLTKKRWVTAQDWKDLALLFGLTIRITPGWLVQKPCLYGFQYPKRYDLYPRLGRFRVYIDVMGVDFGGYDYGDRGNGAGYPVPYGLGDAGLTAFQCLIDRVKPANVVVIWNSNPLYNYCRAETYSDDYSDTYCGEILDEEM